jgi:hypothetical protein
MPSPHSVESTVTAPFNVDLWGVGKSWGCGGNLNPEETPPFRRYTA